MTACEEHLLTAGDETGLPAGLVFEWLVITSPIQGTRGIDPLRDIPGRDKVSAALGRGEPLNTRNYLKSPAVFGFHGIYRVLGVKTQLFDVNGHRQQEGWKVMQTWQQEQKLDGYLPALGLGGIFRPAIETIVAKGLKSQALGQFSEALARQITAYLSSAQGELTALAQRPSVVGGRSRYTCLMWKDVRTRNCSG